MPYKDLRQFLERLERGRQLAQVEVEVEPNYEIAAICRKVLNDGGPALLFNNVKGHTVPLASNLFATRSRFAMALETSPENLHGELRKRTERMIPPVIVRDGPCKERIIAKEKVDLFAFPIPVWSERDSGPFLTLPCDISKDPETGIRNAAIYRSQVYDRRTIGIHGAPYRHLFQHWTKAGKDKPFPIAIAMGCDPTIHIASATPLPFNCDELGLAGSLRGEPVELVACETVPLEVPAHAEIVLEGYVRPETRSEGPFGDWLGYYDGENQSPVMEVTLISHREEPIMLASFEGRPPHDSAIINSVMFETELMRAVSLPGLKKIHVSDSGGMTAIAAVDKHSEGFARQMALALLGTWAGRHIKTLILVDADLDPENWTDVNWALATRFQPNRDVEIVHDLPGSRMDPSVDGYLTSKLVIDATKPKAVNYPGECWPHREIWKKVQARWAHYGISAGKEE